MEMLIVIVILVFSAILHEIMHGFVANKLGDPTARLLGRLTLNPIPHIDPINSILLPLLLVLAHSPVIFGAAKPVPVNPHYFKEGKKDMALVALAGPLTNLALAFIAILILRIITPGISPEKIIFLSLSSAMPLDSFFTSILFLLGSTVYLNLMLAIVNLIPIPPLDGSRLISYILPNELSLFYNSFERIGIFIILFLLLMPFGLGSLISQLLFFSIHFFGK